MSVKVALFSLILLGSSSQQVLNRANTTDCGDNSQYTCGKCTRVYVSPWASSGSQYSVVCTACDVGQPSESNTAVVVNPASSSRPNVGMYCGNNHMNMVWLSVGIAVVITLVSGIAFWVYNCIKRKQLDNRHHADESGMNMSVSGFTNGKSSVLNHFQGREVMKQDLSYQQSVPMQYQQPHAVAPNYHAPYGPSYYDQG